jgi:tetratricopeptide (TPR) repeat protein
MIYEKRGDHEKAEELYQKALAVNQRLDRQEGIAIHSANLATLAQAQHRNTVARAFYEQAIAAYKRIGDSGKQRELTQRLATLDKSL